MLSMISKIDDPLGPASQAKSFFNYSWGGIVSSNLIKDWESWKGQLHLLENVVMKRCVKPPGFGKYACCS